MKIVKLDRRYVLGQAGFKYAVRFPNDNAQASAIRKVLYDMHGNGWSHFNKKSDKPWGAYRSWEKYNRAYWLAVKNESDLTAAILMSKL